MWRPVSPAGSGHGPTRSPIRHESRLQAARQSSGVVDPSSHLRPLTMERLQEHACLSRRSACGSDGARSGVAVVGLGTLRVSKKTVTTGRWLSAVLGIDGMEARPSAQWRLDLGDRVDGPVRVCPRADGEEDTRSHWAWQKAPSRSRRCGPYVHQGTCRRPLAASDRDGRGGCPAHLCASPHCRAIPDLPCMLPPCVMIFPAAGPRGIRSAEDRKLNDVKE